MKHINLTSVIKVLFFIISMSTIAYFIPDDNEDSIAWFVAIVLGVISVFILAAAFTTKLDWIYKKKKY